MSLPNIVFERDFHRMTKHLKRKFTLRQMKLLASKVSPQMRRLVAHLRVPRVAP